MISYHAGMSKFLSARLFPRVSECCHAPIDDAYPEDPICMICGQHCPEAVR